MTTDEALADRIEATGLPNRRSYAICLKIEEWDAVVACLRKSPDNASAVEAAAKDWFTVAPRHRTKERLIKMLREALSSGHEPEREG